MGGLPIDALVLLIPAGFSGTNAASRLIKHVQLQNPDLRVIPILSDLHHDAGLSRKDIKAIIGMNIWATLPRCDAVMTRAHRAAKPVVQHQPRGAYAKAVAVIWQTAFAAPDCAASPPKSIFPQGVRMNIPLAKSSLEDALPLVLSTARRIEAGDMSAAERVNVAITHLIETSDIVWSMSLQRDILASVTTALETTGPLVVQQVTSSAETAPDTAPPRDASNSMMTLANEVVQALSEILNFSDLAALTRAEQGFFAQMV